MGKTLKLWNVSSGTEIRSFSGHTDRLWSVVAFSPDGRYALSGSWDKTLKLWDVSSGAEIRSFSGHNAGVLSVAFSPDGRYALSGSNDRTLSKWDVNSGKEIRLFRGHTYDVKSVAFSPDGRYALSGSYDKTLKLWDTGLDSPLPPLNVSPTAAFSISTTHGEAPLTVTLDANNSTDSDGTIVEYNWRASDGQTASGKRMNMTFPNAGTYSISLVVIDDKGAQSTNTAQQTVTVTAKPVPKAHPIAHLSISPTNGTAPLTVSLNDSGSSDPDGTIVDYAWMASDGQEAFGANSQITFDKSGSYIITLSVTDNDGLTATAQNTVTVSEPITTVTPPPPTEPPPPTGSDFAHLEFRHLKEFYRVAEKVVIELVETVNRDKYTRVDLWVAIELPARDFLFRTDVPLSPWSPNQQPHKTSIENTETSHYIFDFELPEGMGGDYTLYAAYVKEGENPVTSGFSIRSNLVMRQIVLANRKD
jgi:PKD repeat protein